jgi:aspartate/methionine/tyrosine aminotransferase
MNVLVVTIIRKQGVITVTGKAFGWIQMKNHVKISF